jgi:uncharacterized protein
LSASDWVLAVAICAMGGLLQGAIGFGFALLIAPVLAMIDATLVPGTPVMLGIALGAVSTQRNRARDYRQAWGWAVLGSVPGTVAGGIAAVTLSTRGLAIVVAVSVLLTVAVSLTGWHARPTPRTLLTAGAVSGFTGTSTSIGGPPVALLYQRASGAEIRGVLAGYFLITGIMSTAMLGASGALALHQLRVALVLVLPVVAGLLAAGPLHPLVDRRFTQPTVLLVCAAAATFLLIRQL